LSIQKPRRKTWVATSAFVVSAAALAALPFAIPIASPSATVGVGLCLTLIVGLVVSMLSLASFHGEPIVGRCRRGIHGVLEVTPDGLVVDAGRERRIFPRQAIAGGWIERPAAEVTVVVQMRDGGLLAAEVADNGAADEVLHAAGVAPEQRAVAIRVGGSES